jgi:hypothetical protein
MELNANQYSDVMNRFPKFELSYETISHKKVPASYQVCLAVPHGKKAFVWFTFFRNEDVCLFMEIGKDKKVTRIKMITNNVSTRLALGTVLYGTVYEDPQMLSKTIQFIIEDVFFHEGIPLKRLTFGEKLGFLEAFLQNNSVDNIRFSLPVMWKRGLEEDNEIPVSINKMTSHPIHHIQHRTLNTISPYLNVLIGRKIGSTPIIEPISELFIPPATPRCDFSKPQYKMTAIFEVKADLQYDIYHLYAHDEKKQSTIYVQAACIPNYKTSVFMNGLFRKIRENINLDFIEESDDETDFENTAFDKHVYLSKKLTMECVFHAKFKKWTPMRVLSENAHIVPLSKLIRSPGSLPFQKPFRSHPPPYKFDQKYNHARR